MPLAWPAENYVGCYIKPANSQAAERYRILLTGTVSRLYPAAAGLWHRADETQHQRVTDLYLRISAV